MTCEEKSKLNPGSFQEFQRLPKKSRCNKALPHAASHANTPALYFRRFAG
jgi:hypothetical protein